MGFEWVFDVAAASSRIYQGPYKRGRFGSGETKKLLFESIDEVLDAVFEKEGADCIRRCIKMGPTEADAVIDSQWFSERLEELLGTGAHAIEIRIIKNLIRKIM